MDRLVRKRWSHDELVIACGLYFTVPFGRMHARNPEIIGIAQLLGRTPSSLAMKLVNFASLDPTQQARGIKGLPGSSSLDREVWREFQENWDDMSMLSEMRLGQLRSEKRFELDGSTEVENQNKDAVTEINRLTKARTMQSFFRKTVLAAYESKCCVTGNPVEPLLVASHILPWSKFPTERLNPRNGLCLSAHFDRAFDNGLLSFDDRNRLILSSTLKKYLPNRAIEIEFASREGHLIVAPERFSPDPEFLTYHREQIFRRE